MSSDTSAQHVNKLFGDKDIAKNYTFAERATRPPAEVLIRQAGLLPGSADHFEILDSACGTGVVTAVLNETFKGSITELTIVCGDLSEKMVESVAERVTHMDGLDAQARMLDGQAIDMPTNYFTHALTNFGFQSFSEPLSGLRELVRVTKPGGVIGITNWVTPGWEPAFRLAISRIPGAPTSIMEPNPFIARSGRWFEVPWTIEQLAAVPEIDAATINIQHHSFTMELNEEEIRAFLRPLQGVLDFITSQWSEDEQNACGNGKLTEAITRAMEEEPVLVWKSLITTAHKKI